MKLWSEFYDLIIPDVPGCPFAAADIALRQSAITFCEQSLAYKATHGDIAVTSGTASYAFVPPAQAVIHTITYAQFDDDELRITGESGIHIADWRNETGTPEYIMGGATSLTLVPEPDVSGTLTMIVALKPSVDATGVDDLLFNEYREAIVHGALSRLMLSPKKPYSSAQLAAYHAQQFTIKTAAAGMRAARNYTRSPLQTSILRRG
ncbi:phage adaptor protein [Nitrosovibrio sp. Nv4]|uniref:phage adaptor protein n=1 Tax=Nitrosovibrio sp. Nv4 TaxID=1945880 RepID=UPI000BD488D2|nr:hypothetical protein [Nitrosovibrio sp. Nv4]SOD42370.1 hypothetical protein SAMN06298226_2709 [Nitrosovibrio sp. Nv4]